MSQGKQYKGFAGWLEKRLPIISPADHFFNHYPTPRNLNYFWNFGAIAGLLMGLMILTGLVLAMQYNPSTLHAFDSVERIMRDVNYGWLLRYLHMNGASFFFIAVYIHIFRGIYYGSYKGEREVLWILGVVILVLMMAIAFMGYSLVWGNMSFWGVTVITNLFSAIPVVGDTLVTWLWGGFSVDNPTLNRFFVLHFLLPFVLLAVVGLHVLALHQVGSNNPLGIDMKGPQDTISFHPYFTMEKLFFIGVFFTIYFLVVFFAPNMMGEAINYEPANPLSTPEHIVPEWYFLPFYAILRSIPDKLGGVIAMGGAIVVLALLPWLDRSPVRAARFRPIFQIMVFVFVIACIILGFVGAQVPADPFTIYGVEVFGGLTVLSTGQIFTAIYFGFFVLLPFVPLFERPRKMPRSIAEAIDGHA
jgi:ubiquinol-cytochrome c reductase cytochrome b subunit